MLDKKKKGKVQAKRSHTTFKIVFASHQVFENNYFGRRSVFEK